MRKVIVLLFLIVFCLTTFVGSAFAGQKRWSNPKRIKTYIQPGLERSQMMKRAFAEWSRLTKNNIVFYYVDSAKKADIDVIFVDILSGPNGRAGLTRCIYSIDGEMVHATIWIPAKTSDGKILSRDEVYTSMLHEIGHAMGIVEHPKNPHNIMYPLIDSKREISKYDLGELYRIYGWK